MNNKGFAHIILILLLVVAAAGVFVLLAIPKKSLQSLTSQVSVLPTKTTTPRPDGTKYNELVSIDNFITPTPPKNHRSIISLIHPDVPSLKYLSSEKNVPGNWVEFRGEHLRFKYPPDIYPFEAGKQRIAFYENSEQIGEARNCLSKYNSLYSDYCTSPLFVLYYSAYGASDESFKDKIYGYGWAVLYDLNNREWRVQTPGDPFLRASLSMQTATSNKIVNITANVISNIKSSYASKYVQNGTQVNFRDQIYTMISTLNFVNDSQIVNYENKNNVETYKVTISSSDKDYSQFLSFDEAFGVEYIPDTENKRADYAVASDTGKYLSDTLFLNRYAGTVVPGEYKLLNVNYKVESAQSGLTRYIANPKYCAQTSDCKIRYNFCTKGAFNNYHPFSPVWGCGAPNFEGISDENHPETTGQCKNSSYDVEYKSIECLNNSCIAINPTIVCK